MARLLCAAAAAVLPGAAGARLRLIIDTDASLSVAPNALFPALPDIDDDFAVLYALSDPDVDVAGITATFGNSAVEQTCADVRALAVNASFPLSRVACGSGKGAPLTQASDATELIAAALRGAPDGGIAVAMLGSMHNLAAALTQYPELTPKLSRVFISGGLTDQRVGPLRYLIEQIGNANIGFDPAASQKLLSLPVPKTSLTTQFDIQYPVGAADAAALQACGDAVVARSAGRIAQWHAHMGALERLAFGTFPGFAGSPIPWDVFAVAAATAPAAFADAACYRMEILPGALHIENVTQCAPGSAGAQPFLVDAPLRLTDPAGFAADWVRRVCSVRCSGPACA